MLTDSVAKQLDGLKNDGAVSAAIRRFLGKGLDTCGPAGAPVQIQVQIYSSNPEVSPGVRRHVSWPGRTPFHSKL